MASPDYKGSPSEIEREIRLSRQMIRTYGTAFFSAKSIADNYSHFADSLRVYYKYPALIPAMTWKDSVPPLTPDDLKAEIHGTSVALKWNKPARASDGDTAYRYVIYRFNNPSQVNIEDAWDILNIQNGDETDFIDTTAYDTSAQYTYAVTALDRMNNESKPVLIVRRHR